LGVTDGPLFSLKGWNKKAQGNALGEASQEILQALVIASIIYRIKLMSIPRAAPIRFLFGVD
jgi:hypothetical protein